MYTRTPCSLLVKKSVNISFPVFAPFSKVFKLLHPPPPTPFFNIPLNLYYLSQWISLILKQLPLTPNLVAYSASAASSPHSNYEDVSGSEAAVAGPPSVAGSS